MGKAFFVALTLGFVLVTSSAAGVATAFASTASDAGASLDATAATDGAPASRDPSAKGDDGRLARAIKPVNDALANSSWLVGVAGVLLTTATFFVTGVRYGTGLRWQRLEFALKQVDVLHNMANATPAQRWLEGLPTAPLPLDVAGPFSPWTSRMRASAKAGLAGSPVELTPAEKDRVTAAWNASGDLSGANRDRLLAALTRPPINNRELLQKAMAVLATILGKPTEATLAELVRVQHALEGKSARLTDEDEARLAAALKCRTAGRVDADIVDQVRALVSNPDGNRLRNGKEEEIVNALANEELTVKEAAQALFRSHPCREVYLTFDAFLYELHKVEIAIEKRCITEGMVKPLLRYWLGRLSDEQPSAPLRLALEYYMNAYFSGVIALIQRCGFEVEAGPMRRTKPSLVHEARVWMKDQWSYLRQHLGARCAPAGMHVRRKDDDREGEVIELFCRCSVCRQEQHLENFPLNEREKAKPWDIVRAATAGPTGWSKLEPWRKVDGGLPCAVCADCSSAWYPPLRWCWYGAYVLPCGFLFTIPIASRLYARFGNPAKRGVNRKLRWWHPRRVLVAGIVVTSVLSLFTTGAVIYLADRLLAPR